MRFRAGEAGGGRVVTWAHTSDLPNPTEWLATGDLLMSNGLNLPAGEEEQLTFLERLVAAKLSGFAIGDDMQAPPLSPAFLERSDELAFPVLAIPHGVPFVAISRAVANANSGDEQRRLVRAVQLYESLRGGVSTGRLGAPLLSELSEQLGCRLLLLDIVTALPVLCEEEDGPASLRAGLVAQLRERNGLLPGVLRVKHEDITAFAIGVPAARLTALFALHDGDAHPDLALLQHAANIAALAVERVYAEREQSHRLGRELLCHMLDRSLEPASALSQLGERGVAPEESVLVAFRSPESREESDIHHELAQRRLPHLMFWEAERGLGVVADGETALALMQAVLGEDVALGVSDRLGRPDRAPDAAREARWAETAARSLGRRLVRYGEDTPLFLPRTLGEAGTAAERVLGPLIAYDADHAMGLVHSLAVFLEHNRSWQRSAEVLHVHKQTLVYRMHRVEELTGRDLRDTADIVQFWLALRALEFSHGDVVTNGAR